MAKPHVPWNAMSLDERIRHTYVVHGEQAEFISQKFLTLAFARVDLGTTISDTYTDEELEQLLDEAAAMVLKPTRHRA
jgi:hypothetical protein